MKRKLTIIVLCLTLTACASTTRLLDTDIHTIEVPVMPIPPAELLIAPARPAALKSGSASAILQHAVELGAYVGELENQNAAWRAWAGPTHE